MESKIPTSIIFFFFSSISLILSFSISTTSDPQTNLLLRYCGLHEDIIYDPLFNQSIQTLSINLNATLSDIRYQLVNNTRFATAQRPSCYVLFQCRDYLSTSDCLSCFSTAASTTQRDCPMASTSILAYDGCFLRYGWQNFFQQARQTWDGMTVPDNCGNQTVLDGSDFNQTVNVILKDIVAATPKTREYFAAVKREGVRRGDTVYAVAQCTHTVSSSACEDCLERAFQDVEKCPPNADGRALDVGCFLRFSDTAFFNDSYVTDLAALLRQKGDKSKKAIIIGVGVALFLFVVAMLFFHRWKKAKKALQGKVLGATELRGPINFDYQQLKSATKNFSEDCKLGEGGFGAVYLGVMKNGMKVAIKRLVIQKSRQILEDFEKEVKLINNVHHRNLVRLLGCCRKGTEYLLVYEYMVNNSLDRFLFGNHRGVLNWKQRFDIIVGIARGLAYLHEEFYVCIIHRDIKSNNILLDDEFQAKIADFGLARLLPADKSHLNTRFAGTLGYMAPEYAVLGKLSEKVDVYSFGIVVLEIISGQKSREIKLEPITEYLINWAWRLYGEDSLMQLVDESLDSNEFEEDEMKKIIEIALMCTQSAALRPTMSAVVVWLLNKDTLEFTLTPPNFMSVTNPVQNRVPQRDSSTSSCSTSAQATMSITQFSAR